MLLSAWCLCPICPLIMGDGKAVPCLRIQASCGLFCHICTVLDKWKTSEFSCNSTDCKWLRFCTLSGAQVYHLVSGSWGRDGSQMIVWGYLRLISTDTSYRHFFCSSVDKWNMEILIPLWALQVHAAPRFLIMWVLINLQLPECQSRCEGLLLNIFIEIYQ